MSKPIIIISTLLLFFLSLPGRAYAQSASLSISPPVVEILLAPGKPATQTFNLKYQGNAVDLIPELHLVEPSDDMGHVKVNPQPLTPAALPLRVTSLAYPLGEPIKPASDTLALTLTFEAAATDIEHDTYLALVIRTKGSDTPLSSSSTNPAISSLILVTVTPTGSIPLDLEIADFNPPLVHDSWESLTLAPKVVNQTPIMVRPEGRYEVISPSGKTIFSLPLYPHLVLGNSSRKLLGSQDNRNPAPLIWAPSWSNFGPHRLRLSLTTLGGTKLSEVEKIVWIIPIRLLLIIVLFLIIFVALLIRVSRSKLQNSNVDRG